MIKKNLTIIVAILLIIIGTAIIVNASVIRQRTNNLNQQVYLGMAGIIGDGTEENTTVDAQAENDLVIRTDTETSYLDFYITYSMQCDGSTDSGAISLLIQINSENRGHAEALTLDTKDGDLIVENVEAHWGDILSFEISAVYTNGLPAFVVPDVAVGGGLISQKARFLRILNNDPPNLPIINGPTFGKIREVLTYDILVTDPNEDNLMSLEVDFGDEIIVQENCGCENPWRSGDTISISHKWKKTGPYMVQARVMDQNGAWSDWGSLEVSIPRLHRVNYFYQFLQNFLQRLF
jgi:hypothetical protein